jgi:uncharacterized protein YndB with AHSA1/START domain
MDHHADCLCLLFKISDRHGLSLLNQQIMIALYIIGGLIALVLILAALAGTSWNFSKSIHIDASPDKVWEHVSTFKAMQDWNPYIDRDPDIKLEITGTDGTPGSTYSWDSKMAQVGAGSQTILEINPGKRVASRLNFLRPFKGIAHAQMNLQPEGAGTQATWSIESTTPYPMNIVKLFGIIEKNMDRDFGKGLNKLKALSEA